MSALSPPINCPRCKTGIAWPASWKAGQKATFANETRSDAFEAMKKLCKAEGVSLKEAKGLGLHIAREPDRCSRPQCRGVATGETSICEVCRSLTLNW
jgi:hypothetical protein